MMGNSIKIEIPNTHSYNTLAGLHFVMRKALVAAEQIWSRQGKQLVVTCGPGGAHGASSLHYYGYAVDLRTNYFTADQVKLVGAELKTSLGADYDVVVESDHIHVEFDIERFLRSTNDPATILKAIA